mgnify:FL=1
MPTRQKKQNKNQNKRNAPMRSLVQPRQQRRNAPMALATRTISSTPGFGKDSFVVRDRVSVAYDVLSQGSTGFAPVKFAINPGLPQGTGGNAGPFSWIGAIANKFERYKIHKLEFEYQGKTPSTDTGEFAMSVDYDSNDVDPVSTTEMLNNTGARSCKTWENVDMALRTNPQP